MKYFVVEHDRRVHKGIWHDYSDRSEALAALRNKEASRDPHVEVVFFMADSLDELRVTQGRYFYTPDELFARLQSHLDRDVRDPLRDVSATASSS